MGAKSSVNFDSCLWCGGDIDVRAPQGTKCCSKQCITRYSSLRRTHVDRPVHCIECGTLYNKIYSPWIGPGAQTCSAECQEKRAAALVRADRRRRKCRERAAKKNAGPHSLFDPFDIFRRDRWVCQACGIHTPETLRGACVDNAPELDHIVPVSKGGLHVPDNCQLLCRACNITKSNRDNAEFIADMGQVRAA